ncbi:MAG TPA: gamma-glutamyl-gamma-aminobutyrate hydrolase family protein [Candidatus Dormibacteraeota bacterium]|nr:gamma-glutamyl-gamma-aminobutyrate hydrolase family protein [Candidatus Dormibacteraeota bacterium]
MNPQAPRIGIPYRSASEERPEIPEKIRPYVEAVEAAGGNAQLISLFEPEKLARLARELDGFVLPGSSADVSPALYGETPGPETSAADRQREETDQALLHHAFQEGKPVLTICYGTQMLNVFRGGSLVQDIQNELPSSLTHRWDHMPGSPEPHHPARFVPGSTVARLAETTDAVVNSSHHQSIRRIGRGLQATGSAPDGVVESVELEDPSHWVIGVQWHPERQRNETPGQNDSGIRLAKALFAELVRVASRTRMRTRGSSPTAELSGNSEDR